MTVWSDSSTAGQSRTVLGDWYPERVVCFKITEGSGYIDRNGQRALAWARRRAAAGFLDVVLGYHVQTNDPIPDQFDNVRRAVGAPFPQFVLMDDIETWAGKMGGNHSPEIENMLGRARTWLGHKDRAGVYGNFYDLAEMYPARPRGTWWGRAAYTSRLVNFDNDLLWQQYYGATSDGSPAGLPRSLAAFGSYIDLNYSPLSSKALAARMGITTAAATPVAPTAPEGDEMTAKLYHASTAGSGGVRWFYLQINGDRWLKLAEAEARFYCQSIGKKFESDDTKHTDAMLQALSKMGARPNGER